MVTAQKEGGKIESIPAKPLAVAVSHTGGGLAEEIRKFFKGEVLTDDKTIGDYSHDYSIFRVRPEVVVFPRDINDIKNLVAFVAKKAAAKKRSKKSAKTENGTPPISITGRSAGTDMTGGPLNQSIIVSFTKYFNHIKEIKAPGATPEEKGYAVVEPGIYFRDFAKVIEPRGLLYPSYPASRELCALGGMISNNSGGEKSLAYGQTKDFVEEVHAVLADGKEHILGPLSKKQLDKKMRERGFEGRLYKQMYALIEKNYDLIQSAKPQVSKNSSGYLLWEIWDKKTFNLAKVFTGSQGTLGLWYEAKIRLLNAKKHTRMAVIFLPSLDPLADLINRILKFNPESLESYDDKTMSVAFRFLPGIIRSMKGSFFKLIWQFIPEALMVLKGGMPKMVLLAEFAGDDVRELETRLRSLRDALRSFPVQVRLLKNEQEEEKYWTIRRQSFSLLHDNSTGKDTAPFIDDFIVKPEFLPEFLPKLNAILDKYKNDLVYTIAGHPGNGNFHIIPLMDLKDPRVRALIPVIAEEVYKLVLRYKGSITAEHNDGIIRTPYLREEFGGKVVKLFEETKKIFDPDNIFNPGKKVGGTLEYSLEHIKAD